MIQVYSEIGKLKKVLVHRPGNELKQIHPLKLQEMLFEMPPHPEFAQKEHDAFTDILRKEGVEVLYLRDLFMDAVKDEAVRRNFIEEFADISDIPSAALTEKVKEYYRSLSLENFVEAVFCGIRKDHPAFAGGKMLSDQTYLSDLFVVNPLPNCYFTRDSSINIADGVILAHMSKNYRKREPLLLKYIHRYGAPFAENPTEDFYDFDAPYGIEGGDVLILSDKSVGIGCTERTAPGAIEHVAANLFKKGFEHVYAFEFERARTAMHIDGMLTMVDYDKFIVNTFLDGAVNVFELSPGKDCGICAEFLTRDWGKVLEKAVGGPVQLIPCGGGDMIQGMWEMWNLGSNVLTIAPGEVVGYDRSSVTMELLHKAGVNVHTFSGSELSRGFGGPRCMSMPIIRENL